MNNIEELFSFTDIYIIEDDIESSYCYYKKTKGIQKNNPARRVDKDLLPHIIGMLKEYKLKRTELIHKDKLNIEKIYFDLFQNININELIKQEIIQNTNLDINKVKSLLNKVNIEHSLKSLIIQNIKNNEILIKRKNNYKDISFEYKKRNFRAYTIEGQKGNQIVCRQTFNKEIRLSSTGINKSIQDIFLSEELNSGGLILLCGTNGSGKSTTTAAIIKERLELHGGFCMTVEDPVEIPIEGNHGAGICIQIQINPEEGFAHKIRELTRAYPTGQNLLLLIGEIRDGDTAAQALKSAIDGRLVITTIHSDNVESALKRLLIMASEYLTEEGAKDILANSFKLCLHQSLISGKLETKFLKTNQSVSNAIKSGDIYKLNSEIERQQIAINKGIKID